MSRFALRGQVATTRRAGPRARTEVDAFEEALGRLERFIAKPPRARQVIDSDVWIALHWPTRELKLEFLARTGVARLGNKYIDGLDAHTILADPDAYAGEYEAPEVEAIDEANLQAAQQAQIRAVTDSGFWLCLCFKTEAERDDVAEALELGEGRYADGMALAERLGVEFVSERPAWRPLREPNKRLRALVRQPV